eukprot:scaffold138378_cov169-Phaeocystis_antarctica.AAC.1
MCLILRENACATSGRATPGDPRGVGEHWVSSQGPRQAMRFWFGGLGVANMRHTVTVSGKDRHTVGLCIVVEA